MGVGGMSLNRSPMVLHNHMLRQGNHKYIKEMLNMEKKKIKHENNKGMVYVGFEHETWGRQA